MKKCNKVIKEKNGKSRGKCRHPFNHPWKCGNKTCPDCGIILNNDNSTPSTVTGINKAGTCLKCTNNRRRKRYGRKPQKYQVLGSEHIFPCGCSGTLPKSARELSKFAIYMKSAGVWWCRVSTILKGRKTSSRSGNYAPVIATHEQIRKMMEEPNCERCGEPLDWINIGGPGKTPHLHHNHVTGQPYGFTHPKCNPRALEIEIDKLKEENKKLRLQCEQNLRIPA